LTTSHLGNRLLEIIESQGDRLGILIATADKGEDLFKTDLLEGVDAFIRLPKLLIEAIQDIGNLRLDRIEPLPNDAFVTVDEVVDTPGRQALHGHNHLLDCDKGALILVGGEDDAVALETVGPFDLLDDLLTNAVSILVKLWFHPFDDLGDEWTLHQSLPSITMPRLAAIFSSKKERKRSLFLWRSR